MSWVVESNGQDLWSPGRQVGQLFLDEVRAMERLVGQKSGVESPLADTMEINASELTGFIDIWLRVFERTNNRPYVALAAGCLKILIALNAEITGSWPTVPPKLQRFVDAAKTVMWNVPFDDDVATS